MKVKKHTAASKINSFLLLGPIIVFLFFLLKGIALPFVGPNAANFSVYSLIAHNFNKFGYLATNLAPVISVSPVLSSQPEYFFHHPTLLSVWISVLFRFFGEGFWVARLSVVLFAVGTFVLTYSIGKRVYDRRFGLVSALLMSLIPVSTLFGKLIGQEPLVLFFALLMLYGSLQYFSTKQNRYLLLGLFAIFFGMLSDWPMVYFSVFMLPLFYARKRLKQGLLLCLFAGIVFALLLLYVGLLRGGFWDLQNAAELRSFAGLLEIPFWPLRWSALTVIRLLLYFNPIVTLLALLSLFYSIRSVVNKQISEFDAVLLGLFGFGMFHILLYAQASFTHPYLIYYLLPFFTFGAAKIVSGMLAKKQFWRVFALITVSLVYVFILEGYKHRQVTTNLWRYETIKQVVSHLEPYETILVNTSYVLDTDIFWYPFFINFVATDTVPKSGTFKHFVYSCAYSCNTEVPYFVRLENSYQFDRITRPEVEVYIFNLKKKQTKRRETTVSKSTLRPEHPTIPEQNKVKDIYRSLRDFLYAPQI